MKKMYVVAVLSVSALFTTAQNVENFESFNLSPESYDNGSGGGGDFNFGDLILPNFYDTAWGGYWLGFSISNVTDNTTAGTGNQYAAYPGSGANNSSNFAVAFGDTEFSTQGNAYVDSFRIANSTYTALSMRDGDFFGKQFGSIYNANGAIDGTNGEDFLKVWFITHDYFTNTEDSVDFYLADYRFPDSTQDYIMETWSTIDVSSLGSFIDRVRFRFESSDVSGGYINTPTYLVLDDIFYHPIEGLEEFGTLEVNAYPNPMGNQLIVSGEEGELTIYDLRGTEVHTASHQGASHIDVSAWPEGTYVLEVRNERGLARRKLVK